jgi:hypothetical protein
MLGQDAASATPSYHSYITRIPHFNVRMLKKEGHESHRLLESIITDGRTGGGGTGRFCAAGQETRSVQAKA